MRKFKINIEISISKNTCKILRDIAVSTIAGILSTLFLYFIGVL